MAIRSTLQRRGCGGRRRRPPRAVGDVVAAHRVGEEALAALGRPLDRPAQRPGGERRHRVLRIEERLHAEPAADVGRDHPHLLGLQAEIGREHVAMAPAALGAGLHGELARGRVPLGDAGARLHGVADDPVVDELQLDHLGRLGERRLDGRLVAIVPVEGEVARCFGVHLGGTGIQRLGGVGDGREVLVLDLDQLGRVLGLDAVLGHDEGDVVAHIVDLVRAQDRVLGIRALRAVPVGHRDQAGDHRVQLGSGHHQQHAGCGLGRRGVQPRDLRVRGRRAQHVAVRLAREVDVVGVASLAGDEPLVLDPADRLSDPELAHAVLPCVPRPEMTVRIPAGLARHSSARGPRGKPCTRVGAMRRSIRYPCRIAAAGR